MECGSKKLLFHELLLIKIGCQSFYKVKVYLMISIITIEPHYPSSLGLYANSRALKTAIYWVALRGS